MRKITKSLLALALLFGAVGGVNSKTLNVDLSALPASSENTTWDSGTNTFAWSETSWNSTQLFGSGNYSAYTSLNLVTAAGTADHFRVILKFTNGTSQVTINPVTVGTVNLTLSDYVADLSNLAFIESIRLSGANDATGNITISSIYLEGPDINYIEATEVFEAPAGTTDLKDLTGTNASWNVTYPKTLGQAELLCGDGDGSNEASHVTITGYDYLCFNVTAATGTGQDLRVWIWDGEAGGSGSVKQLHAYPIADYETADFGSARNVNTTGTYVVKVSGYNYLKGIKTDWGGGNIVTISQAYLGAGNPIEYKSSGKYVLVGESTGSVTLTAALADANAVYYDATGLTGTGISLDPANPNALFKANSSALTNSKNVIVSDVCANLELTDGKPFKAPAAFTATNAKFVKTVSAAGYATMVVPFAVATLPSGVEAYNLTGVSGEAITTAAVDALTADKPVLIKAATDDYEFSATSAAIAATGDVEVVNGLLHADYKTQDVAVGSYVLQNTTSGVNFYQTDAAITAKPFRAYLVAPAAPARELVLDLDVTTGIVSLTSNLSTMGEESIYTLSGQRVEKATKGLYIVNGKKVMVK